MIRLDLKKGDKKDVRKNCSTHRRAVRSVSASEITEETSFKDDLGADSLDLFELVMQCEEEYGVEFPSDDLENMKTVGDVMRFIKEQGIDA